MYIEPHRSMGSIATYVFQFTNGTSYTVEVRYSNMLERQYLNTEFGPTASFIEKTEGLCGYMDDDEINDFTGPDGKVYTDTDEFANACMDRKTNLIYRITYMLL